MPNRKVDFDENDLLVVAGMLLVTSGVAVYSFAAAMILAGIFFLASGLINAYTEGRRRVQ